MKLATQTIILIKPTKPFNFDATFHKPDHFISGDNYWKLGIRWQTWLWEGCQVPLLVHTVSESF